MCGFVVTKTAKANDRTVRLRGDDGDTFVKAGGFFFRHYLLHVTGEKTLQPYFDGGTLCVYNGEIYNHNFKRSDGENILPLYRKYGDSFPSYLEGEFAIAIYDFGRGIALFVTDPFSSKPLWANSRGECASYPSPIKDGRRVPPGTTRVVGLSTGEERTITRRGFDFSSQKKDSYEDWVTAFESAVKKRANPACFLGLSSGYDSGGIVCALLRLGLPFRTFTIPADENREIIDKRLDIIGPSATLIPLTGEMYRKEELWVQQNVEDLAYPPSCGGSIHGDKASVGLSVVCSLGKAEGRKVYLSGQGSDEVLSDYAGFPSQGTFAGRFPKNLSEWPNFYGNFQEAYISKEEHVAGAHAVETRYPFLDKNVVQEFLWLTPELKNKHYKAPLHYYMDKHDFPFSPGEKLGFGANRGLL